MVNILLLDLLYNFYFIKLWLLKFFLFLVDKELILICYNVRYGFLLKWRIIIYKVIKKWD